MAAKLLREDDKVVYRDSAYLGLEKWGEFKHTPPNIALTAVRVGCPRFPITPLAGSGTSKTANPLYVVRWSIPTELRRIFSVSGKRFTMDCEKISTDYMRSLPVRTCIWLPGRAVPYAPLDPMDEGRIGVLPLIPAYTLIFALNFDCFCAWRCFNQWFSKSLSAHDAQNVIKLGARTFENHCWEYGIFPAMHIPICVSYKIVLLSAEQKEMDYMKKSISYFKGMLDDFI